MTISVDDFRVYAALQRTDHARRVLSEQMIKIKQFEGELSKPVATHEDIMHEAGETRKALLAAAGRVGDANQSQRTEVNHVHTVVSDWFEELKSEMNRAASRVSSVSPTISASPLPEGSGQ